VTDHQFTEGDRVYHRQLKMFGTYLTRDDLDQVTSHVEFDNDIRRVTTAQLVPVAEVDA
jgi:hypothetical protein